MSKTAWPEGVIARYLTVAGSTVDIAYADGAVKAACTGERCPWDFNESTDVYCYDSDEEKTRKISAALPGVQRHAQAHAERCRALPRPTA